MKRHQLGLALTGLLAAFMLGFTPLSVHASGYTFTTVDVPGFGGGDSILTGVNIFGQASGISSMDSGTFGLVYFKGQYSLFADPSDDRNGTFAFGISDDDLIVGKYNDAYGDTNAFLRKGKTFLTIDPPNSFSSIGYGVNNLGDAVGTYLDGNTLAQNGFFYQHGIFSVISDPKGSETVAYGINDFDQIVGYYYITVNNSNGSSTHPLGFLKNHGHYTDITVPGASGTFANGINDLGQIVGSFYNTDFNGNTQGFVYKNGKYTTVNVPGAVETTPLGINQLGDIVGYYIDANFVFHSFIAKPS